MSVKSITVRIDEELITRLDEVAGEESRSRNVIICNLLEAALDARAATKDSPIEDEEPTINPDELASLVAEKVAGSTEKLDIDALTDAVAAKVIEEVRTSNDALFRDISTQMTASVTPIVAAANQSLYKNLAEGPLDAIVARLPEPADEVEVEEVAPEPEKKGFWARLFG